jgi:endonuclease/exonuclease/phosphatase family metal-dependent hydrolase
MRRRLLVLSLVVGAMFVAPGATAQADTQNLKVMTQNLYLGSSLDAALQPGLTPLQFLVAVANIYGTVQLTNYPARAGAIADEIASEQPDLVGLQEVSNWTSIGPGAPPSLDFLAILQQKLADRGLSYSVKAVSDNANIGPLPLLLCSGCALTFQDRDVILANDNTPRLSFTNDQSGSYVNQQLVPSPFGGFFSFDRGWASVDARKGGARFHFANTHLEVESFAAVQEAQGNEFIAGPGSGRTVIATGDFNSAADGSTTSTYANLTSVYRDAWSVNGSNPGFSCCQNSPLTNPTSQLASRIDLVLSRGDDVKATSAKLIGNTPFQATPPFWPSDHAGVVATLRFK